jgi:hypothetical protein
VTKTRYELLRAVCARSGKSPHTLATVYFSPEEGRTVDSWFLMHDVGRSRRVMRTEPLDQFDAWIVYCSACNREAILVPELLALAIKDGKRFLVVEPRPYRPFPFPASTLE